jgi:hypothetical protein
VRKTPLLSHFYTKNKILSPRQDRDKHRESTQNKSGVSRRITWHGLTPDFTLNKTKEIYKEYHTKTFVDIGVAGFKLDEVRQRFLLPHFLY